jgi:hypothetical protein
MMMNDTIQPDSVWLCLATLSLVQWFVLVAGQSSCYSAIGGLIMACDLASADPSYGLMTIWRAKNAL